MQDERLVVPDDLEAARRASPWWGVHAARYLFAGPHVRNRVVLDVACGTGYGLRLLSREAAAIGGVDADVGAASSAATVARTCGAWALAASAVRLPFRSAAFDAVTSFETIEHLGDRSRFVDELSRVLRPGGVLVLSTPNAHYTQPRDGVPANPFHLYEYTPQELLLELGSKFDVLEVHGQTLSSRFGISPFIEDQRRLPLRPVPQLRRFVWRAVNKLPAGLREAISRRASGHAFYPTEDDYDFRPETVDCAPVTVVVARRGTPT